MDAAGDLRVGTAAGRWVLTASVLGTSVVFFDGSVVTAALPSIGADFDAGVSGLQWVVSAYLLALGALLITGGALGDRYGRRRLFVFGLIAYSVAAAAAAVAPTLGALIGVRFAQGAAAAALVPGSLALISSAFCVEDRPVAIATWSAASGLAAAAGPFIGGALIDAVSWRGVFVIEIPLALAAALVAVLHAPESTGHTSGPVDVAGSVTLAAGLGGVTYAMIEGPNRDWNGRVLASLIGGIVLLVAFVVIEARRRSPMLPLGLFRSAQFTGANLTTFGLYGAFGVATFFLVVYLQEALDYSALEAGAALLPATVLLGLFSRPVARVAMRVGPRLPMTIGPMLAGIGFALMGRVAPGDTYLTVVLPAVLVFGVGMTITVAPLTAAVLAGVDDDHQGLASAVNNAVSRVATLFAVALLPTLVGFDPSGPDAHEGYRNGMLWAAAFAIAAGVAASLTVRRVTRVEHAPALRTELFTACQPSEILSGDDAARRRPSPTPGR